MSVDKDEKTDEPVQNNDIELEVLKVNVDKEEKTAEPALDEIKTKGVKTGKKAANDKDKNLKRKIVGIVVSMITPFSFSIALLSCKCPHVL